MTKEEWRNLKKEKGMKIYVPKFYGNHSHRTPTKCEEYTIDTIYPTAATCRHEPKGGWKVEYDFFPCEMLYTAEGLKEKWGIDV
jgi:hypothetical protein